MARKTNNFAMWAALGLGAWYLYQQFKAKQTAEASARLLALGQPASISTAAQESVQVTGVPASYNF